MSVRGPGDFMASFGQALGLCVVGAAIFLLIVLSVVYLVTR